MNYNSMISRNYIYSVLLLALSGLMISPAVFAQEADSAATTEANAEATDTAADANVESSETAAKTADLDPAMQIPVDGSSLEAFNASLATIKQTAIEANYVSLEGAIQYLLVYDIGAANDMTKLAKNLDGKTGDEIIAQVGWGQ